MKHVTKLIRSCLPGSTTVKPIRTTTTGHRQEISSWCSLVVSLSSGILMNPFNGSYNSTPQTCSDSSAPQSPISQTSLWFCEYLVSFCIPLIKSFSSQVVCGCLLLFMPKDPNCCRVSKNCCLWFLFIFKKRNRHGAKKYHLKQELCNDNLLPHHSPHPKNNDN